MEAGQVHVVRGEQLYLVLLFQKKNIKINQDKLHQQFNDDFLQFSANASQGPELRSARKKLKRNLFRAVSEGNVEELQRLLAELKERSSACTTLPVPGELCRHLGESCLLLGAA